MDARRGGERGLDFLRELAQGCVRCPLSRSRTHVVFGEGPTTASLMILGEAPGEDEDAQGVPFVGRAGTALDGLLASVGMSRAAVHIANVVMCRPPALPPKTNRAPTAEEVAACAPYLDLHLAVVRPTVILALGETPTRRLLGPIPSLGAVRGREHRMGGWLVVPTWHPAAWRWGAQRQNESLTDLRLAQDLAEAHQARSPLATSAGSLPASL